MWKLLSRIAASAFCVAAMTVTSNGDETVSFAKLRKDCDEKTMVFSKGSDGKPFLSGERLSDYCVGFIEGVFLTMAREKTICPQDRGQEIDPHFLLSVVTTYAKSDESLEKDAVSVVSSAFSKAFNCNK